MSRFYGSIHGNARTASTRCGTKHITSHTRGWIVGVEVVGSIEHEHDVFHVYSTGGSNDSSRRELLAVVRTPEGEEAVIHARGLSDGRAAGSWVVDGHAPDEACARLLEGIAEGDPEVMDNLPTLQLGEYADDPAFESILSDEGIEADADAVDGLFHVYADAWSEGALAQVEADCLARSGSDA